MIENLPPVPEEWQIKPSNTPAVKPTNLWETTGHFGPAVGLDERVAPASIPVEAPTTVQAAPEPQSAAATPPEATPSPVAPEAAAPVQTATIEPVAQAAQAETVQLTEEAAVPEPTSEGGPQADSSLSLTEAEIASVVGSAKLSDNSTGFDYPALFAARYNARKMREGKVYDQQAAVLGKNRLNEAERQAVYQQGMQNRDLSQNEMNMLVAALAARTNKTSNDFNQGEWDQFLQQQAEEPLFPVQSD